MAVIARAVRADYIARMDGDWKDLDAKLRHERDRQVQLLVGLADAINGLSGRQLTEVLQVTVGVDAFVRRLRQLGVAVTVEYPDNDRLPIDKCRPFRLVDGVSTARSDLAGTAPCSSRRRS